MPAMIETGIATQGLASFSAMAATAAHGADQELALGADVEQAALEADSTARPASTSGVALTSVLTIEFSEPTEPSSSAL